MKAWWSYQKHLIILVIIEILKKIKVIFVTNKDLEKEFQIRKLQSLTNELRMKLTKSNQQLNARVIKEVKEVDDKYKREVRDLQKQLRIAEDME